MAILDFAGGAALQAASECPGAARLVFILEDHTTFTYQDNSYGENALRRFFEWSWQTDV